MGGIGNDQQQGRATPSYIAVVQWPGLDGLSIQHTEESLCYAERDDWSPEDKWEVPIYHLHPEHEWAYPGSGWDNTHRGIVFRSPCRNGYIFTYWLSMWVWPKNLHEDTRDYIAFQTTAAMHWPTRQVLGATNPVSAFVKVPRKMLNAHLWSIVEKVIDDVSGKSLKSRDQEVEGDGLSWDRTFVMEHLQNRNNILAHVGRAAATMSGEKSDWSWNGVNVVRFVCGEAGMWLQGSRFN